MKTLINVILILAYIALLSIAWCNPEKLLWKFVLATVVLYIGWIAFELYRAPTVDDNGIAEKKNK